MGNKNIENAGQDAKAFFSSGFNCAESSLLSACKALEIKSDAVPKIATGLVQGFQGMAVFAVHFREL